MATDLQKAMDDLIRVFRHYSGKEGDKNKLSKAEVKNLIRGELPQLLQGNKESEVVDRVMKDLDENEDGEVDFQEFVFMIAALTAALNDMDEEGD